MAFYEPTHPGIPLSEDQLQDISQFSNDNNLRGFFRKEDLLPSDIPPETVGIRIYGSLDRFSGERKILASKVKANGFELATNFIMSRGAESDQNDLEAQTIIQRGSALFQLHAKFPHDSTDPKKTVGQFSAFFSWTMLRNLLDNSSFDGLCFYEVELDSFRRKFFEQETVRSRKNRLSSYLAIACNLQNGTIPALDIQQAVGHSILSDLPCPGYCVNFTNDGAQVTSTDGITTQEFIVVKDQLTESFEPYLIKWQDDKSATA